MYPPFTSTYHPWQWPVLFPHCHEALSSGVSRTTSPHSRTSAGKKVFLGETYKSQRHKENTQLASDFIVPLCLCGLIFRFQRRVALNIYCTYYSPQFVGRSAKKWLILSDLQKNANVIYSLPTRRKFPVCLRQHIKEAEEMIAPDETRRADPKSNRTGQGWSSLHSWIFLAIVAVGLFVIGWQNRYYYLSPLGLGKAYRIDKLFGGIQEFEPSKGWIKAEIPSPALHRRRCQ